MRQYEIAMDLCRDMCDMVSQWMLKRGVSCKCREEDVIYQYLNWRKKRVPPRARAVLFSRQFHCPEYLRDGLALLTGKLERGEDVNAHLSRRSLSPAEPDELLYDWGIYHFHLGTEPEKDGRFIKRTGHILFARVEDRAVYCINTYPHGRGAPVPPWCRQEMLAILDENWPETLQKYKLLGCTPLYPGGRPPTDSEYALLRAGHITTPAAADHGVCCMPPGGGMMASGHSTELMMQCIGVHNTLKSCERHIRSDVSGYIQKLADRPGGPPADKKRIFCLGTDKSGQLYVADLATQTALVRVELSIPLPWQ